MNIHEQYRQAVVDLCIAQAVLTLMVDMVEQGDMDTMRRFLPTIRRAAGREEPKQETKQ